MSIRPYRPNSLTPAGQAYLRLQERAQKQAAEIERLKAELAAIRSAQYHCNICGGLVDLRGALRPTIGVGPGPGHKTKHSPTGEKS